MVPWLTRLTGRRQRAAAVLTAALIALLVVPLALITATLVGDAIALGQRLLASPQAREVFEQLVTRGASDGDDRGPVGVSVLTPYGIGHSVAGSNNVAAFKAGLAPLLTPGARLILDLGAVEFMDSAALGSLLTASRTIEAGGGALCLASLTPPVRTLFELVRLHRVFEIMNDANEAAA